MRRRTVLPLLGAATLAAVTAVTLLGSQSPAEPATRSTTGPATGPAPIPATGPAATQPAGPEVFRLTLRPAAATRPTAAHRLLPDLADQTPGDAVPLYLLARRYWPDPKANGDLLYPENGRLSYLDTPIEQFPPAHAQRIFEGFGDTLALVDQAARRTDARWDACWRDPAAGADGLARNFVYLADLHHAVNILGFRAAYRAARGDWAGAEASLRTSFGVARHVGAEPTTTPHALTQSVFAQVALYRVMDGWVGRAGAPNLYWALTDLPRPFVDPRPVAQGRRIEDRVRLPRVSRAIAGDLPPDQWPTVLREMVAMVPEDRPPYQRTAARVDAEVARLTAAVLPRARAYVAASGGSSAEAVAAMSTEQAVGTYFCRQYADAADGQWKAFALPYPQAVEVMAREWRMLAPDRPPVADNPLVRAELVRRGDSGAREDGRAVFAPDYRDSRVADLRYQLERPDRLIALLRAVEALRDHAAAHGGRLPARLGEVSALPVPPDPLTGEPFAYRLDGRTAVLEASAPPGRGAWHGYRFELTPAN